MSEVNGFNGFVGYSIRELSMDELNAYCLNISHTLKTPPFSVNNFTSDFMVRAYSSGCYYYDLESGKWSSYGIYVYEDTNLTQTHCSSNHLTAFAGGLVLLPSKINFQYAFSHPSPIHNPFIYSTIILITCVYILFALWARWMDLRDLKKMNITFMEDNHSSDSYFYELIVFTGDKEESGTNSKVSNLIKVFLKNRMQD
jgi:hypothetical protein